jgi:hypothetical protein
MNTTMIAFARLLLQVQQQQQHRLLSLLLHSLFMLLFIFIAVPNSDVAAASFGENYRIHPMIPVTRNRFVFVLAFAPQQLQQQQQRSITICSNRRRCCSQPWSNSRYHHNKFPCGSNRNHRTVRAAQPIDHNCVRYHPFLLQAKQKQQQQEHDKEIVSSPTPHPSSTATIPNDYNSVMVVPASPFTLPIISMIMMIVLLFGPPSFAAVGSDVEMMPWPGVDVPTTTAVLKPPTMEQPQIQFPNAARLLLEQQQQQGKDTTLEGTNFVDRCR